MYYVYALVDPIQKVPFYIGKGKNNRMYCHLKEIGSSRKHNYIKNIRTFGFEPLPIKIVDNIMNEKEAYDLEYFFIQVSKFKYQHPLTNRIGVDMRPPSRKGSVVAPESLEKRRRTLARKKKEGYHRPPMSDAQKVLLSKINKGKEGPNKVYVDVSLLHELYIIKNLTKKQVCGELKIGLGSLNRILAENKITKIKTTRSY